MMEPSTRAAGGQHPFISPWKQIVDSPVDTCPAPGPENVTSGFINEKKNIVCVSEHQKEFEF